ncbi:SMP-30/gluconolactonase/LRE family protein [Parabacteroides sp. Marseille-P3160]|uniref:SMP-30/gluconolactonase/LRE family protein n=1 Tax=Parabacteroides sp. Marseille-P3160 TaxID=1917887 RepID=UPI0009B9BA9F|nr:SMP-30/gluconolactonase/LRE family protein [Parabacteroides sp. Marseille-P3160]
MAAGFWIIGNSSCSKHVEVIIPDLIYKAEATTGEGSIWHPDRNSLFWVDIEGKTLYELFSSTEDCRKWSFDRMVTTVVPESDTTVIVALQNEIIRFNLENGVKTSLAAINDKEQSLRFNDGKCSPNGSLWVGTMSLKNEKGAGTLYCLHPDGTLDAMLKGVSISNGIVWSKDRKYMYYNDTPTGKIQRFRYDDRSGDILLDGTAVILPRNTGGPDGMTIDSDDNLWVAQWGGFGVYCYNPYTGELLTKIDVPAPNIASCAFGGKDMDTLYITTARAGLSENELEDYPLSGSVFCCKPGAVGIRPNYFGQKPAGKNRESK